MRCGKCNKKKMMFDCKYCQDKFCSSCLMVEIHNCRFKDECFMEKKDSLTKRLKEEAHTDTKRCEKV